MVKLARTDGPSWAQILAAKERIGSWIHKTPVLTCSALDRMTGARLYFKAENLQRTGSFKFRGASNAVLSLDEKEARTGVATHSSGNFAQALALAARLRGLPAYIVMPGDAPATKREAVEAYGGIVTECAANPFSRETTLAAVVRRTGAVFVHPYDDPVVIAGQGTAALELVKEIPDMDMLVAPLGGGGLLSGTAIAAKGLRPDLRVFGAEPETADDAYQSLATGRLAPPRPGRTVADGLRTGLSERTFAILRRDLSAICRVSDREILQAMRLLWERAKTVVEPSGAAGLAAVLRERDTFAGRKIGIILSGGNMDFKQLKDCP
ncbi:MAG: pyridoxal-phosphate dependent enzyme [Elusimicrobiota bacterium]